MSGPAQPRPGNVPAELTSFFVDRQGEIGKIGKLLSTARLVTLTGTPGVGKTRLALRVVAELNRPYPGGVWFVELDAVADGAYLAHTVAQTLEIHDQSGRDPVAPLVEFLRAQETLLVWDNCEHLVKECAVLAKRLLREVAHLRILTTSRAALRV